MMAMRHTVEDRRVLVRHEQAAVHMADGPREPLARLAWCW